VQALPEDDEPYSTSARRTNYPRQEQRQAKDDTH